jgi:hypothetical protein
MHTLMHGFQLLFLRIGHVLKLLHPIQYSLLLLWGTAVEVLQAIAQLFLAVWRQLLKLRITLQQLLLFLRGKVVIFAEPSTSWLPWTCAVSAPISERPDLKSC